MTILWFLNAVSTGKKTGLIKEMAGTRARTSEVQVETGTACIRK